MNGQIASLPALPLPYLVRAVWLGNHQHDGAAGGVCQHAKKPTLLPMLTAALRIAPVLQLVVRAHSPLSVGIRLLANSNYPPNPDANENRNKELRGLIKLQGNDGNADDRERKAMLSSILDLNEISVEAIMTEYGTVSMINADQVGDIYALC